MSPIARSGGGRQFLCYCTGYDLQYFVMAFIVSALVQGHFTVVQSMDQGLPLSTERAGVIWFLLPEVEVGVVG